MNVYAEFLYWGVLGLINLAASVLIYHSTKLERKQKLAAEYEVSTRAIKTGLSLPSSFTYLSTFTGMLNTGGAFLRFRRIHFLEIPTIPWLANFVSDVDGGDELMELLEAKWLVAMNDWTSLFLALTFLFAGCLNFATVRQLRLRDQWVKEALLPVYRPRWQGTVLNEKGNMIHGRDLLLDDEKTTLGPIMLEEEEGKSFALFSPLCTKRGSG